MITALLALIGLAVVIKGCLNRLVGIVFLIIFIVIILKDVGYI